MKKYLENRIIACVSAVFCTLLWGTAFPFIKLGYQSFEIAENDIGAKLLFAGLRFFAAGIMVYIFSTFAEKGFVGLKKSDVVPVTALGLVQTAAQYIFTYIGIGFTSGTNTSVITACASFLTVLFAAVFFKNDRLTLMKILGCVLGFMGVLAINWGGNISLDTGFGDFMIFLSTVSAAAGNLIAKKASVGRNPVQITAFQLMIGGLVLTVIGILCGGRLSFGKLQSVLILLWLAFVSAAAFSIWTALLKYHPASMITVFNLLVPVFGTVLSGVMLGENVFRAETLVSLLLISVGIAAVNLSGCFKSKNKGEEMKIKGVISDMDGVILDTEKLYARFWCEAANFYGYPMERSHALSIRSMARPLAIERLKSYFGEDFDYYAVHSKRIELMDKYIEENGIEAKPGAELMLAYLKENGYRVALATATGYERTKEYLERLGLFKYFDEIVCAAMVECGKPAPDIYLYAAEKLGLRPQECIALEDSQNGIKSASSAGCKTVMVPDLDEPADEIKPLLYDVADGLVDVIRILNN